MPSFDERLEAVAQSLELLSHSHEKTQAVLNVLAEDQAASEKRLAQLERLMLRNERVISRIGILLTDHEERIQEIENNE